MKKIVLFSLAAAIALPMSVSAMDAPQEAMMDAPKEAMDAPKEAMDTTKDAMAAPEEVVFDPKVAKRGKKVAIKQCFACHDITEDKQNRVGPPLWGVYGKPAGSVEGYEYSEAHLSKADSIVWDEATLDAYLQDPKALVPGNKMAYPIVGLPVMSDKQRKKVIEFLKSMQ